MSRDWLVERPGRDEDDLERETEDEEDEERARDLQTRDKKETASEKCTQQLN